MDIRNSVIYSPSAEKIYHDAIQTFGPVRQLLLCVEECNELSKSILKFLRHGNAGDPAIYNSIAEEVADVLITTAQVVMMLRVGDEVERIADEKIRRLQVITEHATAFRETKKHGGVDTRSELEFEEWPCAGYSCPSVDGECKGCRYASSRGSSIACACPRRSRRG